MTRPERARPERARAEGTRAEGTRSEGTRAEGTRSQGTRSQGTQSQGTQSQGTGAAAVQRHGRPGRRRSGRRSGDSGTREAILAAARVRFGEVGYDRSTIRDIAAAAGVDPALVHHYFGTKERLFAAAMELPVVPGEVIEQVIATVSQEPGRGLGEHLVRTVLGIWEVAEMRATFLGLLRTAVSSDQAVGMLREFVTENILSRVAQMTRDDATAAGGDPALRAALAGSQVFGLGLARYVLELEPLARASTDELAAAIGPALERYLTGDLRAPQESDRKPGN